MIGHIRIYSSVDLPAEIKMHCVVFYDKVFIVCRYLSSKDVLIILLNWIHSRTA